GSGVVLGEARFAVRVLYAGDDPDLSGAACAESQSERGRRTPWPRGQPVPLHGLSEYRPRGLRRGRRHWGATMSAKVFGSGIRRREDPRLITGSATYTDDIALPGMAYAAILRSPHAHARIKSIDTSRARQAAGVVAVYTGADIEGVLNPMPCAWLLPNADLKVAVYPQLAKDVVRYVGDAVAVVVAEDRVQAQDALDLIDVGYLTLPAVVDPQKASAKGAPLLHAEIAGNQAFHWTVAGGDIDQAFEHAEVVVKERIVQQRLIPTAMETRSAVARWTPATRELTLWNTTQNPHIVRFLASLIAGVPEDKLRVIAPEVGGGFGSKIAAYPGEFITIFCSMKLGR